MGLSSLRKLKDLLLGGDFRSGGVDSGGARGREGVPGAFGDEYVITGRSPDASEDPYGPDEDTLKEQEVTRDSGTQRKDGARIVAEWQAREESEVRSHAVDGRKRLSEEDADIITSPTGVSVRVFDGLCDDSEADEPSKVADENG